MDSLLYLIEEYLVAHVVNENILLRQLLAQELDLHKLASYTLSKIEEEYTSMYLESDFKFLPLRTIEEILKGIR